MRDLKFVSMKINHIWLYVFEKQVKIFFITAVSKFFWPFFAKCFNFLYVWILVFLLFLFRRMHLCLGWLVVFSMSRMLKTGLFSCYLIFLFCNLTFKNQELIFLLRSSLHCAHFLYILVYHSSFVQTLLFIFILLIFFQLIKIDWFQLFVKIFNFFFKIFVILLVCNWLAVLRVFWITFIKISLITI